MLAGTLAPAQNAYKLQGSPKEARVADLIPEHLLVLHPPPKKSSTGDKESGPSLWGWCEADAAAGLPCADPAYPALRRAAQLSYVLPFTILGADDFALGPGGGGSEPEGRQQLLEAPGVEARLTLVLRALRKRRRSLEAALKRDGKY